MIKKKKTFHWDVIRISDIVLHYAKSLNNHLIIPAKYNSWRVNNATLCIRIILCHSLNENSCYSFFFPLGYLNNYMNNILEM